MTNGIYTLANDFVYDQLVALLNSIEANVAAEVPVCVIPYNDQLDKVRAEVATRSNVTLFDDTESISRWENFAIQAWKSHEKAQQVWQARGASEASRLSRHRKFCCFDGPFERFIYFDADTLSMGSIDHVFQKLDEYDWVTNDFQYKSQLHHIFDYPEPELLKLFSAVVLKSHIFCSGWFASKKGVFNSTRIADLLEKLQSGEANILSLRCIDQPLLNYLVLRSGIPYFNYAFHGDEATGSHWSSQFEDRNHVLYDRGKPITYLHYMSVGSEKFTQLCKGEDVEIPYQDLFLHYRYLKTPQARPKLVSPSWLTRMQRTTSQFVNQKVGRLKSRLGKFK